MVSINDFIAMDDSVPRPPIHRKGTAAVLSVSLGTVFAACSNGGSAAPVCADGGGPAPGPADMHCGTTVQQVLASSCHVLDGGPGDDGGSGDDGGASDDGGGDDSGQCNEPGFGPTMYGTSAGDDDCKYNVTWSVPPICENQGVTFTVAVTSRMDGSPVTGANVYPDAILDCRHPAGYTAHQTPEGPPGTYKVGPVTFDRPGKWTVRFHIHAECYDLLPTSQHGHAAFFVDVP